MAVFVTAINCIDGRVQVPISQYLKKRFDADYVDMITCPGPVRVLSLGEDQTLMQQLHDGVRISRCNHGSRLIAVVAHHDCAANNVSKEIQFDQMAESINRIEFWKLAVAAIGLWVNDNWDVEEIPIRKTGRKERELYESNVNS
jgi:hypothetical protein